ncbi:hypothetical protein [Spiroplasma endosymbiont of Dilophus febrilis]|uniref:hypothetical protein n=1 Tax=Spiroplasma endosymbiont of Dilophus febrilis TaxID=3066292 RepID=UPI00313E9978
MKIRLTLLSSLLLSSQGVAVIINQVKQQEFCNETKMPSKTAADIKKELTSFFAKTYDWGFSTYNIYGDILVKLKKELKTISENFTVQFAIAKNTDRIAIKTLNNSVFSLKLVISDNSFGNNDIYQYDLKLQNIANMSWIKPDLFNFFHQKFDYDLDNTNTYQLVLLKNEQELTKMLANKYKMQISLPEFTGENKYLEVGVNIIDFHFIISDISFYMPITIVNVRDNRLAKLVQIVQFFNEQFDFNIYQFTDVQTVFALIKDKIKNVYENIDMALINNEQEFKSGSDILEIRVNYFGQVLNTKVLLKNIKSYEDAKKEVNAFFYKTYDWDFNSKTNYQTVTKTLQEKMSLVFSNELAKHIAFEFVNIKDNLEILAHNLNASGNILIALNVTIGNFYKFSQILDLENVGWLDLELNKISVDVNIDISGNQIADTRNGADYTEYFSKKYDIFDEIYKKLHQKYDSNESLFNYFINIQLVSGNYSVESKQYKIGKYLQLQGSIKDDVISKINKNLKLGKRGELYLVITDESKSTYRNWDFIFQYFYAQYDYIELASGSDWISKVNNWYGLSLDFAKLNLKFDLYEPVR